MSISKSICVRIYFFKKKVAMYHDLQQKYAITYWF